MLAEYYPVLKLTHVTTVVLTGLLFAVRGVWMLRSSPLLHAPWVRITPHVIDTLLLLSGILLSVAIAQYPFVHSWLTAKLVALLLYIGLGMMAIRHGRGRRVRATAWMAALVVYFYIVSAALAHDPLPWA